MKKVFDKKIIFGFIIGGFIFGSIGVLASNYLYKSDQVSYDGVKSNVREALNDLYSIGNSSPVKLPYYIFAGENGYISAYYNSSTTFNISNGTVGLLGPFDFKGVKNINLTVSSYNSNYSGTIHVSVSENIPQSLSDMQSSPIYTSYSASSLSAKKIDIPNNFDTSKKYWIFFYTNSCYGGYCAMAVRNLYLS